MFAACFAVLSLILFCAACGSSPNSVAKGTKYTYLHDQWHLYIATVLSDTTIKVEQWYRFDAAEDGDPFTYKADVCILKTNDNSTDFKWLDDKFSAFSITMQDPENFYWEEETTVGFSIEDPDSEVLGANVSDSGASYSYLHDQWNLYKAIALSDSVIKIEQWSRFDASEDGDPFAYESDICLIDINSTDTDFEWFDKEHTGFSITMQDVNNYYWDEPSKVNFTIEL